MRKLSLVPMTIASLALVFAVACGGGDDDDSGGADAAAGGGIDGGGGGTPDGGGGGTPDAGGGAANAANLGQPCGGTEGAMCPAGYECVTLQGLGSATEGFCTLACAGQGDDATCQNMFPGPGDAGCYLTDGMGGFSCGVICTMIDPPDCPTGLGCFDTGQMGIHLCAGDEGV